MARSSMTHSSPSDRILVRQCRESTSDGTAPGTAPETKKRIEGALQPSSSGPSLRWEHEVELWKHPKVSLRTTSILLQQWPRPVACGGDL